MKASADRTIAELAARQHGVITRAQLTAAGLGRGAIAHRLRERRLHRLHRGVYLVGHGVAPALARELAASVSCGAGAVVSHRSAAALWQLVAADDDEVDVVVGGRHCRTRAGVRVHRMTLARGEVTALQGVRVTTPARTLLDIAVSVPRGALERAVEDAQRRRLVRRSDLMRAADSRRHAASLRAILRRDGGPAMTRSEAEARLLALLRAARLPAAEHNVRVGRHEVDLLWRRERLVVEVDGYAFHSTRAAFERDRLRDAELQAAGLRVMRVTWRQIVSEPEALVARLAQALAT